MELNIRPRLTALNVLRGLAFCLVYIAHAGNSYTDFGPLGVSLFFVMSGFLMVYNYYGTEKIAKTRIKDNFIFSWKKIKGLYLLHILTTLAMLLLKYNGDTVEWLIKLALNLLLIQEWFPSTSVSINPVSWYLSVAVFVYFIFPWIIKILEKRKPDWKRSVYIILSVFIIQIALCFIGGVLVKDTLQNNAFEEFTKWIAYKHPLVRSIDFIIGCLIGYLFITRDQKDSVTEDKSVNILSIFSVVMSIIAVFLFLYMKKMYGPDSMDRSERWWTYCSIFIPGSLLTIWGFAEGKGWLVKIAGNRFFDYCGAISSVAFLIHTVVINYTLKIVNWSIKHIGIEMPSYIITVLIIPICFVLTVIAVQLWNYIGHFSKKTQK